MDLNVMMREQARAGLQRELDAAVTNGDTAAATAAADKIAALAVSSAPKAPPYGPDDVRAELDKLPWFGVDPRMSARAVDLGKTMDLKKFATAAAFAAALVKVVDEEFKPKPAEGEETDEEKETRETAEAAEAEKKPRRTDGPSDGDATARSASRGTRTGPWLKISDAPPDVQKEINRSADKLISSNATNEQREGFILRALESHYGIHQRAKAGKK